MSIVKRDVNDETFGQNLSDVSVIAFQHRIHCDALIVSGDGGEIRAHQVTALIPINFFFRQNERISFSTLHFDEIFML